MERGFSLIELIVTVAIVGIVAALAVSQFEVYRGKANDMVALSSIADIRTAQEANFEENEGYVTCAVTDRINTCSQLLPGMPSTYPEHLRLNTNTSVFRDKFNAMSCSMKGTSSGSIYSPAMRGDYREFKHYFIETDDNTIKSMTSEVLCL